VNHGLTRMSMIEDFDRRGPTVNSGGLESNNGAERLNAPADRNLSSDGRLFVSPPGI